jgi:hypothetical protein
MSGIAAAVIGLNAMAFEDAVRAALMLDAFDIARGVERYTRIVRERDGVVLAQRWGTAAGAPMLGRSA